MLPNLNQKYNTAFKGQPLSYEKVDLTTTSQKQNKYYSTQDHDGTIRKKLIIEYPKHSEDSSLFAPKQDAPEESTKMTDQHPTSSLITRLRTTIDQYQPRFQPKTHLDKLTFNQLDFGQLNVQNQRVFLAEDSTKQEISNAIRKQRLLRSSQQLLSQMLPVKHVAKIDRQISALYKENRDVNLEYRRGKFMKIFLGKAWQQLP